MKQLFFTLALLFPIFSKAQLVINETSNSNGVTVIDADGNTSDWIEVYNTSGTAINLQGYGLTDDPEKPMKWVFPNYILPANGFLVVLASGDGSVVVVDHYETAIFPNDSWQYIIPSANIPNWTMPGFNTTSWTTAPLGIGYGDSDDATTITDPTLTVYARREFTISDPSKIINGFFDVDFDDGFAAYLNGVEIARSGLSGNPVNWDDLSSDHEAGIYQGGAPQSYAIDSALLASAMITGTNVLAVEVHNASATSSDLSLIPFLTFGFNDPATFYGGNVHNWFNGSGSGYIQTNFSIKTGGETVYLSTPAGIVIDSLAIPDLEADMSFGKQADGVPSGFIFTVPTPATSNNAAVAYSGYEATPVIDFSGGFYASDVNVSITNRSTTGGVIHYTLDGQTPTTASAVYSAPLTITATTVLKARCFSPDAALLPSLTATESYFLVEDFTLPVISITTDDANLYGADGIFDNFNTDWKRPCFIEYFDASGQKQFSSHASIKPDGGAGGSRSYPQHSVTIEPSNNVYGEGEPVHYPLIPEKPYIGDYYAFYLRNGSNYWNQYPQKDATFMRMMRETHANSQAYAPVIAFVNGEYFGVYELREKANKEYFEVNYGNNPDSVDLLSVSYFYGAGILRTVKGSDTGFYAMHDFVTNYSAASPDYFDKCHRKLDLYNFADYIVGENWFANQDWIFNNMKIARTRTAGNRWRFFLQDMEAGIGGWSDYTTNMFDFFRDNNQPNAYWNIYDALVQNTKFRQYFVNRYADLMNTIFQPAYYTPIVNGMYNELLPEIPRHFQRWTGDVPGGMATFAAINDNLVNNQFVNRNDAVRNQILTEFGLTETVDVTLDVVPPGAGYIKISTIVPESLPWTGVYFDGVPVQITAVPNPGYTFTSWQPNAFIPASELDSTGLELNIGNDASFIALFSGTAHSPEVTISEVNYHADPTINGGNWIELHNYSQTPLSLDDWKLKSKHFWDEYVFPLHTTIPADGYLVICEDINLFKALHPQVTNFVGSTGFGWGNRYDSIQLYNAVNDLVISTVYSDSLPFPRCADGWGRTLENHYTQTSQLDSSSWYCGCIGGSPGTAFIPCTERVNFSEINYNSISADYSAGDWVELKNTTNAAISLAGYTFKDKKDEHVFILPAITIPAGGYWVLTADNVLFANRHKQVANFSGVFNFGLGEEDILRLYDNNGILVTSVIYNSQAPWPDAPALGDYTLEYNDQQGYRDQNDATSWFAGCEGGSPGRTFTQCPDLPDGVYVGIYPNPTNGVLNVVYDNERNSSQITELELFDLNGNILRKVSVQAIESMVRTAIDVDDLANGLYFVRLLQAGRVEQVQFVKI